jgi:hypothetical protein
VQRLISLSWETILQSYDRNLMAVLSSQSATRAGKASFFSFY